MENLRLPAKIFVDAKRNEAYVADGYGNHRLIVFDADTGKYRRHWGAYGKKPSHQDPGPYQPGNPPARSSATRCTAPMLSRDDLLYACDRANDRIQVFKPDGPSSRRRSSHTQTLRLGLGLDIAFSSDPQQKFLYVAHGESRKVHILSRDTPGRTHQLRRRRPAARTILRRAQHRDRRQGQPLYHRDVSRAARAALRL